MKDKYSAKWSPYMLAAAGVLWQRLPGESKRQNKTKRVFNDFFVVRILYIHILFII
jgi:hypothetical protein